MKRPAHYLKNTELLAEIIECKAIGRISDRLARCLMLLAEKYSLKPNFRGYSYRDEMVAEATTQLVYGVLRFDPAKSSNPFAYCTTICHNAFLRVLEKEAKVHKLRDDYLIAGGEWFGDYISPSLNRIERDYWDQIEDKPFVPAKSQPVRPKATGETPKRRGRKPNPLKTKKRRRKKT